MLWWFKFLCFISVVLTLSGQGYAQKTQLHVSVAFLGNVSEYDPLTMRFDNHEILCKALYRGLLRFDHQGRLQGDLAKSYFWRDGVLVFELHHNLKTSSGEPLGPVDAAWSLQRLWGSGESRLAMLGDQLCPEKSSEGCAGIKVRGQRLLLDFGRFLPGVLSLFAQPELAVVPKPRDGGLKLDHRQTSGAYYVTAQNTEGVYLQRNPYDNRPEARQWPEQILVRDDRPLSGGKYRTAAQGWLESGQVQLITSSHLLASKQLMQLERSPEFKLLRSPPVSAIFLAFTPRGLSLPAAWRQKISAQLQARFKGYISHANPYRVQAEQFFAPQAPGRLRSEQLLELRRSEVSRWPVAEPLILGVPHVAVGYYRKVLAQDLGSRLQIQAYEDVVLPDELGVSKTEPHLVALQWDVSQSDSIWFLASLFQHKVLRPPAAQKPQAWLAEFMGLRYLQRAQRLQELHFSALVQDPQVIPLLQKPHVMLSRLGWRVSDWRPKGHGYFWELVP